MTITGTKQEINVLKHKCDGRCTNGEWCIFKEYADLGVCPVDTYGLCLEIEMSKIIGFEVSTLNDR